MKTMSYNGNDITKAVRARIKDIYLQKAEKGKV